MFQVRFDLGHPGLDNRRTRDDHRVPPRAKRRTQSPHSLSDQPSRPIASDRVPHAFAGHDADPKQLNLVRENSSHHVPTRPGPTLDPQTLELALLAKLSTAATILPVGNLLRGVFSLDQLDRRDLLATPRSASRQNLAAAARGHSFKKAVAARPPPLLRLIGSLWHEVIPSQ